MIILHSKVIDTLPRFHPYPLFTLTFTLTFHSYSPSPKDSNLSIATLRLTDFHHSRWVQILSEDMTTGTRPIQKVLRITCLENKERPPWWWVLWRDAYSWSFWLWGVCRRDLLHMGKRCVCVADCTLPLFNQYFYLFKGLSDRLTDSKS
jgi:hypothetical protein